MVMMVVRRSRNQSNNNQIIKNFKERGSFVVRRIQGEDSLLKLEVNVNKSLWSM